MRKPIVLMVAALSGACLAFGGCGGSSTGSAPAVAPTSTQADDEAAADVMEHHRHHHHGGVTMFIAMSLDTLGVDPGQHAVVEKIQADLRAKMEPARVAEQNVLTMLADGIAAGAIDTAKVDAAIAQAVSAAGGLHDATTDALNQLHAVLTPEQRAALVDKVQAHWAIWRHANAEEQVGAGESPGVEHLGALAKELGLSADQVEKVRANMSAAVKSSPVRPDPQAVDAHMQAFATAFKGDSFDAKSLTTASAASSHLAGWGASRMARLFESLNPVLTPDQRAKLSQRLREHLNHEEGTAGQ